MKHIDCDLKVRRKGHFFILGGYGTGRCGTATKKDQFAYETEITISDKDLDAQGFVIDHNNIHGYFISKYEKTKAKHPIACERIAIDAIHAFHELLPHAKRIFVRITGGPVANLTATWPPTE